MRSLDQEAFRREYGEFGGKWARKYKNGDASALPTLTELMNGLISWYSTILIKQNQISTTEYKNRAVKRAKDTFVEIFRSMEISQWNKQFSFNEPELNLENPYSKVTCLILYLNSMELGDPPLYAEVNRVARDMDMNYLETLGPFLRGLSEITLWAESNRRGEDIISPGFKSQGGLSYNIGSSFILWRGSQMKPEGIQNYKVNIGNYVSLPGCKSTSKSLTVALSFALEGTHSERLPVLFVIACQNFSKFHGVAMTNEAYSAYPAEQTVLLSEGCGMYVLAVHRDYVMSNSSGVLAKYKGETI